MARMEFLYILFIKKNGSKNIFFLGEKWFWKNRSEKKKLNILDFPNIKIWGSEKIYFFSDRFFQNHFSPRKKIFFWSNFFLMKSIYKNSIRAIFLWMRVTYDTWGKDWVSHGGKLSQKDLTNEDTIVIDDEKEKLHAQFLHYLNFWHFKIFFHIEISSDIERWGLKFSFLLKILPNRGEHVSRLFVLPPLGSREVLPVPPVFCPGLRGRGKPLRNRQNLSRTQLRPAKQPRTL